MALLDHERRRKCCRPLPLRTPQRNVSWRGYGGEEVGRRGERKRRLRARGGQKAWVARLSGSRPSAPSQRARHGQVAQCGQTCDPRARMRGKSLEFSGLALASAGHVRERLAPARSDRDQRAAAHTCLLSRGAPMPLRMSALVHSSRCTKSSRSRSRGGIQHHLNNFLSGRTDPSCTLE